MDWNEKYIAVDWGTTNRRAWLVDPGGNVSARFADNLGLMAVPPGGFEAAAADIRQQLGPWPMLLAGMVGSDQGWQQAPYVACPASAKMLADNIVWIDDNRSGIVPGVCQTSGHPDVMRGEEVQAIGAVNGSLVSPDAYICHPGTHAKWIRLERGQIAGFTTMMTGELFNLLRTGSILSPQMQSEAVDGDPFRAGLDAAFSGASLSSALFTVRAQYLLSNRPGDGASYASGLLIGSDVRAGLAQASPGEEIALIGRADLTRLYALAIESAGHGYRLIDGDRAFLAGIAAIVPYLEKERIS
ncbi:2-dehydro-3-deoxygalactonokinase [Sphingopyxis alaskensis]|uniref:2-dehydro-3-deoxygalactonokinase n=1 Tax=Sphingopyxis alaskensis TaxID=117207 RepID=UPI00391BBBB9